MRKISEPAPRLAKLHRLTTQGLRNAHKLAAGLDHEILVTAHEALGQIFTGKGDGLLRLVRLAHHQRTRGVVEANLIASEGHLAHQIRAEVFLGPLDLPRLVMLCGR